METIKISKCCESTVLSEVEGKYVFFWLLLGTVMYFGMGYAISKQEVVECNKLVSQSQAGYDNFYITQLEDAMCRSHEIIINARVEK